MKYLKLSTLIVLLSLASASMARAVTAIYEHTPCANGFQDAYTITSVDQWGCVISIDGVNCDGRPLSFGGTADPRPTDLGLSYDMYYTGIINGQMWYAKIRRGAGGTIDRVWGQRADGSYYEIVAS